MASAAPPAGDAGAVRWRPWDADAFAQARAEGKRVLLSISASWCHWCHVMDEESFAHPEVIRRLNSRFIPVRVDSDQRPDVNSRYNMGGWPTVAILDGDGEVIAGETYLPTGPFLAWLDSAARAEAPQPRRTASAPQAPPPPELDRALVTASSAWVEQAYDHTFGGFGRAPKFPQPWAVELLLRLHARTGESKWRTMATLTLDAMREGELCDLVEGGFFRYAAGDDWSAPHTEKLLEVNAQLLSLYLLAGRMTDEPSYRATAQAIADYLFSTLLIEGRTGAGPAAWFAGSQTADGDYYALSQEERLEADPPPIDRTLYVDRNAMAASALLAAGGTLRTPDCREAGLTLLESLWANCRTRDGDMAHHSIDGRAGWHMTGAYLADQAWLLAALLDAGDTAGRDPWIDRAEHLASVLESRWWDDRSGGFWDRPVEPGPGDPSARGVIGQRSEHAGLLRVQLKPLADNAAAAIGFTRLARQTGKGRYRLVAERTLQMLVPLIGIYKQHAAPVGVALERWLEPDPVSR
ncbi:MAG TPA: DUF255 domain-containing protein [Nitrospiria bacterium]|nr:DUF255 domain-containing protein [Nitrospiria bacterium]